jgi:polysaccharide biosynthesis protein PslH
MIARLPTPRPRRWATSIRRALAQRIRRLWPTSASTWSSCTARRWRQYVERVKGMPKILDFGDMDSQKWLEYAHYKPFPLSLGYWLEGHQDGGRREARWRALRPVHRTTRAEWETLEGYGTGVPPTGSPTASISVLRADDGSPTTRHDLLRRAHGLLPQPGVHVRFCAKRPCRCCGAAPRCEAARSSAPIRRRDAPRLARLPGVTVTGRCPTCSPTCARVGADGGAAEHRPRHAEQDPGGMADGRAGGQDESRPLAGGVDAVPGPSTCWSADRRRVPR